VHSIRRPDLALCVHELMDSGGRKDFIFGAGVYRCVHVTVLGDSFVGVQTGFHARLSLYVYHIYLEE
jgi:hypothetical protein